MPKFVSTRLEEDRQKDKGTTIGVWFNDDEIEQLKRHGKFLHQEKPSTIIKQMVGLAAKLIGDYKIKAVRDVVFNNVRKNKRLGIDEIDPVIRKS